MKYDKNHYKTRMEKTKYLILIDFSCKQYLTGNCNPLFPACTR